MKKYFILILFVQHLSGFAQELPIPKGLKAKVINNGAERFIQLTWQKCWLADSSHLGYNLLVRFPQSRDMLLYQNAGVIYDTTYQFPINSGISTTYEFALMSIKNFPKVVRSKPCSAIEVTVPSSALPNIEIAKSTIS